MREHTKIWTVDMQTGYDLLLSRCSYNMACDWLERELAKYNYEAVSAVTGEDGLIVITVRDKETKEEGRKYFYDEERGYLLGE